MIKRCILLAAMFMVAAVGAAHADDLRPIEGRTIDFGDVAGVVYYTVEHDDFHLVATFAQKETGTPVRFETVLPPGQTIVLSSPREIGASSHAIEISREGDRVLVQEVQVTN